MRSAICVLFVCLLAIGGCKKGPTQAPVCESYLACLAATSPQEFASALPLYGPEGECWRSEATAANCETACRTALASRAAAHPQCKSGDGGGLPLADGMPRSDALLNDGLRRDSLLLKQDFGPLPVAGDVDILFVIDNSNSMDQEQKNLIARFGQLIEALRNPKLGGVGCSATNVSACKIPNLHIGVISTDLGAGSYSLPSCEVAGGDGGKLQIQARQAGCHPPSNPWISYTDGITNIPGGTGDGVEDVKKAFSCIAEIGTGGCGFEHQLEAARRALDPARNVNPGFLRPSAYLAIVFVTDEDDCSAQKPGLFDPAKQGLTDPLGPLTSFRCFEFGIQCDKNGRQPGIRKNCVPGFDWLENVQDYAAFFTGLKAPGRTFVLAIAGPIEPVDVGVEGANPVLKATCQGANGIAVPAIRIASMAKALGPTRGFFNVGIDSGGKQVEVNICSTDFGPALRLLGEHLTAVGQ